MQFEKWGRRAHWEYDAVRLGRDDHGTWLGYPDDIVALAVDSCASVRSAVEAALPPYDVATSRHWLTGLAAAMMQP